MEQTNHLLVSFCVIARNEEKALPTLLNDLLAQQYPHHRIEVVLVDALSSDGTKSYMKAFQKQYQEEFFGVQVLENPKLIQAAGWNVAIKNAKGDAIFRIDAHSHIPADFVLKNVQCLESGEFVSGGQRPCLLKNPTSWQKTLLLAENSLFGSSIAPFRRDVGKVYVNSLFHGAYRREVFETVGGFNEELGRTEDNEMHYRIRQAGYRLCYDPQIISYQHVRSSLSNMLRQKYANGRWIGLTSGVCPGCLSLYHFVPLAFIFGILLTSILALVGIWQLAALMWGLYGLLALVMTVSCVWDKNWNLSSLLLPILFLLLHVSYGAGTVVGLAQLPGWKKQHHGGISPSIEDVRCCLTHQSKERGKENGDSKESASNRDAGSNAECAGVSGAEPENGPVL